MCMGICVCVRVHVILKLGVPTCAHAHTHAHGHVAVRMHAQVVAELVVRLSPRQLTRWSEVGGGTIAEDQCVCAMGPCQ